VRLGTAPRGGTNRKRGPSSGAYNYSAAGFGWQEFVGNEFLKDLILEGKMNRKTALSACAVAVALAAFGPGNAAAANLLSGDVDIVNYYPSLSTPYNNGIGLVEGSGPTASPVHLSNGGYYFTFAADTLTFVNDYCCAWSDVPPGGWGGFVLTFSGVPDISNVVNDSSSTLTLTSLTFNSDTIWMEYVSTPRYIGAFTTLDVSFATPEPSTWAMLIMGFAGLGIISWRRDRRARWRENCRGSTA
jgi:hypothetical protein